LKAFLLAAGHGTRLRPLTDSTPKCLLPIRGIPILSIWLEVCRRFGIDEVLINVHAHSAAIREFLQSQGDNVLVSVVEEEELLGSAGTLRANRDWVAEEAFFWVFYADVLHNINLAEMQRIQVARNPMATLAVYQVPDPTRCGIVNVERDGTISEFIEKPKHPRNDLAFAGILMATPAVIDEIPNRLPVDIGFDLLPRLTGRMLAYRVSDFLIDMGTMENYQAAQTSWPGT
jgi:mannose-1-phosphate guanylyltransferase